MQLLLWMVVIGANGVLIYSAADSDHHVWQLLLTEISCMWTADVALCVLVVTVAADSCLL